MTEKKKIVVNIAWLTLEYLFKILAALVINALVARHLGVEHYGVFQYALAVILVFSSISFVCGAEVLVPALVTAKKNDAQELLIDAFALRLLFSLIAYAFLIIYALVFEVQNIRLFVILGAVILLNEPFGVVSAWLQSQTDSRPRTILVNLVLFLKVLFLFVAVVHFKVDVNGIAAAWLLEGVLLAIGLTYIFNRNGFSAKLRIRRSALLNLWRRGAPFFISLILAFLFMRVDMFALRFFGKPEELGLYASAFQLLATITAFSPILVNSLAPLLIYAPNDDSLIKSNILKIVALVCLFSMVLASGVTLLGSYIIPIIFGKRYVAATPIFVALSWASVLVFADAALNLYLIKKKRASLISMKWIVALLVSLPVYLVEVPEKGAMGAVFGYIAGYASACVIGAFLLFRLK